MKLNLKHYSALAAAFLAMKNKSDGQIIYKNIDTTIAPNHDFKFDFNSDGNTDLKLSVSSEFGSSHYGAFSSFEENAVAFSGNEILEDSNDLLVTRCGDSLTEDEPWVQNGDGLIKRHFFDSFCLDAGCFSRYRYAYSSGNWKDVSEGLIALKISSKNGFHYGWLRIDVSGRTLTIKDYAYEEKPNTPILAGDIECNDEMVVLPNTAKSCDVPVSLEADKPCSSYEWFKVGEGKIGIGNQYVTSASGDFFVVTDNGKGCIDTSNICSVLIFSNPSPPKITIDLDTLVASAAVAYQWYYYASSSPNLIQGAINQKYVPTENAKYSVLAYDSNNCSSISEPIGFVDCKLYDTNIYIDSGRALIPADSAFICQGGTISLSPLYQSKKYEWFRNDSLISNYYSINISDSGTYFSNLIEYGDTCPTKTIRVLFLDSPSISLNHDTLISSSPSQNQWYYNGSKIPGAIDRIYIVTKSGYYFDEVFGSNGCSIPSDTITITITSLNPIKESIPLVTLVNHRQLEIKFLNENFLNGKITILNALGQPIKELTIDKNVIEIPFAQNETGWFIIDIEKGERRFRSPIIIF